MVIRIDTTRKTVVVTDCDKPSELGMFLMALAPDLLGYEVITNPRKIVYSVDVDDDFYGVNSTLNLEDEK